MKVAIVIQLTLNTWKLICKSTFFSNFVISYGHFRNRYCVLFESLLGWECAYLCHDKRNEKEGIYNKTRENKTNNWHTIDLYPEN